MPRSRKQTKEATTAVAEAPATETSGDVFDQAIAAQQPPAILHAPSDNSHLPADPERRAANENGHAGQHEHSHAARYTPSREDGQSHAEAVGRTQPRGTPDPFGIAHDLLAGVRLTESRRYGKMLIAFEEKPSDEVRAKMNEAGFRWEPLEKTWARELRDNPMSVRIDAERLFNDVSKMIRSERGIEHSVGVTA